MAIAPTPLFRTKSQAQQLVEHQIGEPLERALHRLYVEEGKDQEAIANELGLDRSTVSRWMRDFGIRARPGAARRSTNT